MALTADQALEKVGSFGRFQLLLLLFSNALVWVWIGWPLLVMTFIAAEPPWMCVATNGSMCTFPGPIKPTDDLYEKRCSMPRKDWKFTDDFTSVVTEVGVPEQKFSRNSIWSYCFPQFCCLCLSAVCNLFIFFFVGLI